MISLPAVIFVLGILIFVHELGHHLAAKSVGIGVHRFSIGLGPATPLKFTYGETEYVLAWIPFGGYVKMASREEQEQMAALEGGVAEKVFPEDRLFENKPLWARIMVISAGVIMNVVFAWVVFAGLALAYGISEDGTTRLARVDRDVLPISATALADLPFGTEIVAVNEQEVQSRNDILRAVLDSDTQQLTFAFAQHSPVSVELQDDAEHTALAQALVPLWESRVGGVVMGSVADKAGLQESDLVRSINGQEIRSWEEMVEVIEASPGVQLSMVVERDGADQILEIVPKEEKAKDPTTGDMRKVGRVGITPHIEIHTISVGVVESMSIGARKTWWAGGQVIGTIVGMFRGLISPRELGGPLAIAQMAGQAAEAGFEFLMSFTALLSVNLAILNLLPIPALDGGHLVFLILEGLRGNKPVSLEFRMQALKVGIVMLLGLMVFVFGNDILRLIGI